MKILFLTTHFNTGGITSYLLSLTRVFSKEGHQVFVASAGGNCESILESYGGRHINLGFRTKSEIDLRIYLKLGGLKEIIQREGVDLIHAQTRVTQVMGFFLSRMTGKPLITTCHGFFKPRFFRRIFPCWGNAVIAVSQPVQEHLVNDFHVEENKISLIGNGIDITLFPRVDEALKNQKRVQWKIEQKLVIGMIARLSDVKGIDVLIQAMPSIIRQFSEVLLLIVGEGAQEKYLLSLVDQLNLKSHVRFEKIVNQTPDILPVFDIFVMPSRQEGLGLSVMEAQACGIPVVASRVGGLVDLIEDGKTGYLVPVGDAQSLADKIVQVLRNLNEAKRVGLVARENITKEFSIEQMMKDTQRVYEKYISR